MAQQQLAQRPHQNSLNNILAQYGAPQTALRQSEARFEEVPDLNVRDYLQRLTNTLLTLETGSKQLHIGYNLKIHSDRVWYFWVDNLTQNAVINDRLFAMIKAVPTNVADWVPVSETFFQDGKLHVHIRPPPVNAVVRPPQQLPQAVVAPAPLPHPEQTALVSQPYVYSAPHVPAQAPLVLHQPTRSDSEDDSDASTKRRDSSPTRKGSSFVKTIARYALGVPEPTKRSKRTKKNK